jgi:glycine hydroxymethyltransferase
MRADKYRNPTSMSLAEIDPELHGFIQAEKKRQRSCIELIASENFTSAAVMECLGSCLTNKYSEGYPGARYYGGNEVIDKVERLCQERALVAFGVDSDVWGVNVQPYSGSPANMAVYTALLRPHDRIMGLDLPAGGHLTHGFSTLVKGPDGRMERKAISASSIFFESVPYSVDPVTGLLDYDEIDKLVRLYKPKLLICGGSAYPREWNYERFRAAADSVGALLMADIAHISGLVATGEAVSPFKWCDIVTTTTHKSLRGPRAGMIFFKKAHEAAINAAVFPGLQGGPHQHQIAALATQLREVVTDEFKVYAKQVRKNAVALAETLIGCGCKLVTDGTDNHLLLLDLKPHGLTGGKFQRICDMVGITLNKNTIVGDTPALSTGVRIGACAMTTRGLKEIDFQHVGIILMRTLAVAERVQREYKPKTVEEFGRVVMKEEEADIYELQRHVREFAESFPMPGL